MVNPKARQVTLPEDFDPATYLELNPDVRAAGADPAEHYRDFGHAEGRQWSRIAGTPGPQDASFHANPRTKRPKYARHQTIWQWIGQTAAAPGLRVLEVGSRSVSSDAIWKTVIPEADYTGLDILDGKNVDVIGDAHRLGDYFEPNSFDLVISFAVFEHLAMPWLVVEEVAKVLKPGGHVVIETHFSFSEHEQPWHYFQFNSNALEVLFCKELGFELIDSGLDTPIIGRFSNAAPAHLRGTSVKDLYCHSAIIARKFGAARIGPDGAFDWRSCSQRLTSETSYPMESDLLRRQKRQASAQRTPGTAE